MASSILSNVYWKIRLIKIPLFFSRTKNKNKKTPTFWIMTSPNTSSTRPDVDGVYVIRCIVTDFLYDAREIQLEVNISANIAFNFILSTVAIMLNVIVSYVMLAHTKYQTPSYFLLLNNAILDAIFPVTLMSWNFILMEVMNHDTSCTFINTSLYIGYVFGSASVILAIMMALDRFLAIFRPFFYHEKIVINYKTYGPYILTGWVFSIVFTAVSLLTPNFSLFYGYATLLLSFAITFGTYVSIRTHILVRNITEKTYPSIKQREREERRKKHEEYMNKLTTAMIFVLLTTYVPFTVYSLIRFTGAHMLTPTAYAGVIWVYTFIYSKSIANPLLFAISMSTLRRDIGRLFKKKSNLVHMEISRTNVYGDTLKTRTRQQRTDIVEQPATSTDSHTSKTQKPSTTAEEPT